MARLPIYLRGLVEIAESGATTVSSEALAEAADVNSAKVRKDLSHLGSYGTRGVGYDVAYLIHQIRRELGLTQDWAIVIVGIGNLGHALANYKGFAERGFRVAGLVDADPAKVGEVVGGLPIRHIEDLPALVADEDVAIGVMATPAPAVQEVADLMVAAGIRSILNFAPAVITVPAGSRCARWTWRSSCRSSPSTATEGDARGGQAARSSRGRPHPSVEAVYFAMVIHSTMATAMIMTPSRMNWTLP